MSDKFAGVGSTVGFIIVDDQEFNQVKIVDFAKNENEVSKSSILGEALMFCKEGDEIMVRAQESYEIKVVSIVNPVKKDEPLSAVVRPFAEPVLINNFVLASTDNYASFKSDMNKGLLVSCAYGKKAIDVYEEACNVFGWDSSKKGYFSPKKMLYEKECTKEGYAVWFLTYSNLNNYNNSAANWIDYVSSNFEVVKEVWKNLDERFFNDNEKRVTFAKQKNGQYIYLGIFQAKEWDEENKCKTFCRVAESYGEKRD